jgi:hypothetical protein
MLLDKVVGTPDGLSDGVFEGPAVGKKLRIFIGTILGAPEELFIGLLVG